MGERVLVIGARRRRQGIGGYVARAFHDAGCDVCGVVGTTLDTAEAAKDELADSGITTRAFDDLAAALQELRPKMVAVCSPYLVHRQQLTLIADAGCHCLCEKPLWWDAKADMASQSVELVDSFLEAGLLLELLTQWPQTLDSYFQLFSQVAGEAMERFEMRLSPVASGPDMVLDAMPHVLSMLWALVEAPGEIESPQAEFRDGGRALTVHFDYRYPAGVTHVSASFVTCPEQPRPAWYGINGCIAARQIDMSAGYAMQLVAVGRNGGASVSLPDPLPLHVRAFVQDVRRGREWLADSQHRQMRRQRLIASVTQLATLYHASREAAAANVV